MRPVPTPKELREGASEKGQGRSICLAPGLAADALVTLLPSCFAPPPHTYCPGSNLDSVTAGWELGKSDHFAVHMCLTLCPRTHWNTPADFRAQGKTSCKARLPRLLSEGTVRDQPCTADQSHALSAFPCPVPGRSLVGVDRLDPLGEGTSIDPGLASCGLEVRWEGWGADR